MAKKSATSAKKRPTVKALVKSKKPTKTAKIAKKTTKLTKPTKSNKPAKVKVAKKVLPKSSVKAKTQKVVKVKKVAQPYCPKGYNSIEYQKYKSQTKRLQSFSNQQLKQLLRKNLQSMSGNKDQMIAKCADGIVLGRIPRCPNCFGGRPKYDYKAGTYHCSGYRDDVDFKNCHTTFTKEQLKRDPWEL